MKYIKVKDFGIYLKRHIYRMLYKNKNALILKKSLFLKFLISIFQTFSNTSNITINKLIEAKCSGKNSKAL